MRAVTNKTGLITVYSNDFAHSAPQLVYNRGAECAHTKFTQHTYDDHH